MSSRIQSFMIDLGFRSESMPPLIFNKMAYFLQGFDTLIVCARTLGEDARLTSLLTRIDQFFSRNAEIVELHGPGGFHGAVPVDFGADLKSLEVEIDGWYTWLSNSLHSRSPTLIDVIEIIDSVLEDLRNFHRLEFSDIGDDSEGMEEKLQFLRNFIEFVEMLNADHQQLELQGFVIQVASFAVSAAQVCARLHGLFDAWNVQGWKQDVKHGWKQIQPQILVLLQRIRPTCVEVSWAYKTALSISKTSEELRYSMDLDSSHYSLVLIVKDFIDFLLWCLWEILEMDSCVGDSMKDQVQPLWGGLKFLRAHAHRFDEEEIRMAICNAGIVISSAHHPDSGIAGLVEDLEMIVDQVKGQMQEISVSTEEKITEIVPQSSLLCHKAVFSDDEIKQIIDRLTFGSSQLCVVPIVGMAGLGKTTFALHVYNHPAIRHHYHCGAGCTVSPVFNRKKVVVQLLNQIRPDKSLHYVDMTEDDLVDQLRRSLEGKRYLVLLDDVWGHGVWESLRICFPDDSKGSRILLTSRDRDVIPLDELYEGPYLLRLRSDVESLEILRTKLFPEDDFPVELHELAVGIAESCKGLPSSIVAVAGLLATLKPDVWKKVLESLASNTLFRTVQFITASFELSYRYLPDHLKYCLLYFGLFPEKEEVSAKWFYLLWIAEGLIPETQGKNLEDVAMQYMNDLVNRSLVIVTNKTSLGEIKTCRVHPSIHEFCIRKAEVENFSHILKGYRNILAVDELRGSQRLCIQASRRDFKSLRLSRPDIHSLLFLPLKDTWPRVVDDVSFIVRVFKSLRALHIRQMDLGEVFPVEMKLLVELRYLAVRGHFADIPSSIGNLSNLETLIVDSHLEIALPGTIWDLHKLRHLCIENGFHFHFGSLDDSSVLFQLESCSVVLAESRDILERLMKKFPNVSKLKMKCRFLDSISIPDRMHQLESLHVSTAGVVQHCHQFELNGASQLRSLTLKDLVLTESLISSLGKLPRLESLKLLHVTFSGGGLHMEEEDFQKLKYFKLSDSNILRWTATGDDPLPSLQELVLQGCICLEEIPWCLGVITTLESIELLDCSSLLESLVGDLAKIQLDYGNIVSISITSFSKNDLQ